MEKLKYKNIVFDLGGVIINLDTTLTTKAFSELGRQGYAEVEQGMSNEAFFKWYETGKIHDHGFREKVRDWLGVGSQQNIDHAWNSMLLDIPDEKIQLLKKLKEGHRTFLLSNTNQIHIDKVHEILLESAGYSGFEPLFEKVYYSHLIKMRKPNTEIYEYVLDENGLKASETLFIDDNMDNLKGAEIVGINTLHIDGPETLLNYFNG